MQNARIAIYARYSSDLQRPTSIEDQFRRCKDYLGRLGFDTTNIKYFKDEAISGKSKEAAKRIEFQRLVGEWRAGNLDIVVADEVSRFARARKELNIISELLDSSRARLMTADGMGSRSPQFKLIFQINGAVAAHFLDETAHRVRRGLRGQLKRGYWVSPPPFGYRLERIFESCGKKVGTKLRIHDEHAKVVRLMYQQRAQGETLEEIARELNVRGIKTPRRSKLWNRSWRVARIMEILRNPIYKGVFIWKGSETTKENGETVGGTETFIRPELRLVSDEAWNLCNPKRRGWMRGGDVCELSGIVRCGQCDRVLTVSGNIRYRRVGNLYCRSCAAMVRVLAAESHLGYVSGDALRAILKVALEIPFTNGAVDEFKSRLRARLSAGVDGELDVLNSKEHGTSKARTRLLELVSSVSDGDSEVLQRFREVDAELKSIRLQIKEITERKLALNEKVIKTQMKVDPIPILRNIFDSGVSPQRLRAVIAQIFPRIIFRGKPEPQKALFELQMCAGAIHAVATDSAVLESSTVQLRFLSTWDRKSRSWIVTRIEDGAHPSCRV